MSLSISRPLLDATAVERLLHAGLANAAAATVLAVLVALLCRLGPVRRRPAVVHGLWLLVLLKLLAPPMWSVSIHAPVAFASKPAEAAPAVAQLMELATTEESEAAWENNAKAADAVPAEPADGLQADPQDATAPAAPAPTVVSAPEGVRRWVEHFHVAAPTAAVAWAAGTLGCLAVAAVRIVRFRRVLRHASAAPREVQARTAALSAEVGLRPSACPGVSFVPGAVSPMLWALPYWLGGPCGPRLLLPAALWEQLDHRQRDTILLHELAHLRRRDHWVRLLELAVTAIWWWHPVAWWARRRLREAEEQCCDAWVVWARPASVHHYATALLEALEFAAASIFPSDRQKAPALPAVPALASGMAEFHELKRRLVMIKQGTSTGRLRKLSWAGLSAFCGMAALLLPLMPRVAVAQEAREKQDDSAPAVEDTADGAQAREADAASGSAREAAETHEAEEPAKDPHGVTDYTSGGSADGKVRWKAAASASEAVLEAAHMNLRVHERLSNELARARADVERARAQLRKAEHELAALQAHVSVAGLGPRDGVKTAQPQLSLAPPMHPKTATVPVKPAAKGAASDGDREARLRKLEDNLGMLLQEVKALRDERHSDDRFDGKKKDNPLGQPKGKPQEPGPELKRLSR